MTFACIGAVDALHTTLDWVARSSENDERLGIVIFSDNAKYAPESSGEYTQGAGGGALLIRRNPRLLEIPDCIGVSTTPVHDFFKPRREVSIRSVISNVLQLAQEAGQSVKKGLVDRMIRHLPKSTVRKLGIFAHGVEKVSVHRDDPVLTGNFPTSATKTPFVKPFSTSARKRSEPDELRRAMTTCSPSSGLASSCTFPTPTSQADVPRRLPPRPRAHRNVGRRGRRNRADARTPRGR